MAREHLRAVNTVSPNGNGDDPNSTVGGYSPTKFWQRSSDTQGHSVELRTKVPKFWQAEIDEAVDSRHYPYKSAAAFVRDAVWHRLQWIRENEKDASHPAELAWELENMEVIVQMEMLKHSQFDGLVENIERAMATKRHSGDIEGAGRLLKIIEAQVVNLPEPFKSELLGKVAHYQRVLRTT